MTIDRLTQCAVVVGAMLLAGCRDTPRAGVLSPGLQNADEGGPAHIVLVIERDSSDIALASGSAERGYLATLRLDDATPMSVGSITAALDFDSTRVRFLGDASPADAALRAVHVDRGRVRIAAASAVGLPNDALVRLRFASRDTLALRTLKLAVSELHALDATDLARAMSVSAPTLRLAPGGGAVGKPVVTP